MEVSWQVTGIRQDAFAETHRIPVEEDEARRASAGPTSIPRLWGRPPEAGVDFRERESARAVPDSRVPEEQP